MYPVLITVISEQKIHILKQKQVCATNAEFKPVKKPAGQAGLSGSYFTTLNLYGPPHIGDSAGAMRGGEEKSHLPPGGK
jgi:hypothetical protein